MTKTAQGTLVAALCACLTWAAVGVGTTRPEPFQALQAPAPDPAAPVDYLSWINNGDGGRRDNAFDAYLAAYERLARFEGEWGEALLQPWLDNSAVTAWLQANEEGLALFRRAAARSDFFFLLRRNREIVEPRLKDLLLAWEKPNWRVHLEASKALLAAGWRAWLTGDEGLLRENALLALRAAHHLQSTRWPISRLIGDGTAYPAYIALRNGLAKSHDPGAWAAALKAGLERDDPPAPSFGHACSLLRIEFWDLCQRVFLPRGADGGWPVHRGVIQALTGRLEGEPEAIAEQLEKIGLEASLRESDAYHDALERWNGLPFHQAAAEPLPLDRLLKSSRNPLHRLQGQLTVQARARVERTIAQRRATHLVVQLRLHKARFGAYPDRLGQLDIADLATLRLDPFSGGDFVYRRNGDDFILYSLAFNLTDDGGRHDPEWTSGDYIFWPVRQ